MTKNKVVVDTPSNVVVLDILSAHLPAFDIDRLVKLTSGSLENTGLLECTR